MKPADPLSEESAIIIYCDLKKMEAHDGPIFLLCANKAEPRNRRPLRCLAVAVEVEDASVSQPVSQNAAECFCGKRAGGGQRKVRSKSLLNARRQTLLGKVG